MTMMLNVIIMLPVHDLMLLTCSRSDFYFESSHISLITDANYIKLTQVNNKKG